MLDRLVGMFAFAIYDREKEVFFLARDFFGIKPMYYRFLPGTFGIMSAKLIYEKSRLEQRLVSP
jgi:asparagine synthase (glutamine-hydrolysing)